MLAEKTFWHHGRKRRYLVQPGPRPATILALHGGFVTARAFADETRFHERTTATVIYPQGANPPLWPFPTWNAGSEPPTVWAEEQGIDDLGFIREVLARELTGGRSVYACGHSNGGRLVYHLAGDAQLLTAGASVSGVPSDPSLSSPLPCELLHLHGDADWVEPVGGGGSGGGGLPAEPGLQRFRDAGYPVTMQMIPGGVHRWDFGTGFDTTGAILEAWGMAEAGVRRAPLQGAA